MMGTDRAGPRTTQWGRPRVSAVAMVVVGVGYAAVYPVLMGTSRPGWVWDDPARNAAMEHMLYAVYVTLGIFLIGLAREPERALPLINWVIVANLVHGTVMLVHALGRPGGHAHLLPTGDVWGTYSGPLLLLACHPRLHRRRDRLDRDGDD